ncbi:MAG: toprim domain-containing protein [Rubrivivax sp.]|nr:toprim domain-containing protein [Rubrivivax sp.]MDZ4052085.1 toprim domain-containing protein [Phenylobacterium sp.]
MAGSPLADIVRALGGDIYAGGTRANIPAPRSGRDDRSVSLAMQGDRLVIHCFGKSDWKEVKDWLRDKNLIDAAGAPMSYSGPPLDHHAVARLSVEKIAAARTIWDGGRAVTNTLSAKHAMLRKIRRKLPGLDTLRHCGSAPISVYRDGGRTKPALALAIRAPNGDLGAIELTYLDPDGQRSTGLRISRKMVGDIKPGSAVRIDPADDEMLVAEGFWTTLSASERFQLPCWALLSTSIMRSWTPPPGVKRLLIAADHGRAGEDYARDLAARVSSRGVKARVVFTATPPDDWNDVAPPLDQPPEFNDLPWTQ